MKKFIEICEEIKKESAKKSTKADEAHDAALDNLREVLRAFHAGRATEAEKEAATEAERKAADAYAREEERNTDHRLTAAILRDNAKQAFFADYIGKICEIWNKYEGKPHGEKTAEKIRAELRALTGHGVYIGNQYNNAKISIYTAQGVPVPSFDIVVKGGADAMKATDENNKILRICADNLRVGYCGEYVYNIPEHIKQLKKAHAEARKAYEKAQEAISKYNALTRGEIQRENIREGIRHNVNI